MKPGLSLENFESFDSRWICEVRNYYGFEDAAAGFIPEVFESFLCFPKKSATEEHRDFVKQRLADQKEVATFEVGPLIDVFWDPSFIHGWSGLHPGPFNWLRIPGRLKKVTCAKAVTAWLLAGSIMRNNSEK